jgi:hypothetical protein
MSVLRKAHRKRHARGEPHSQLVSDAADDLPLLDGQLRSVPDVQVSTVSGDQFVGAPGMAQGSHPLPVHLHDWQAHLPPGFIAGKRAIDCHEFPTHPSFPTSQSVARV